MSRGAKYLDNGVLKLLNEIHDSPGGMELQDAALVVGDLVRRGYLVRYENGVDAGWGRYDLSVSGESALRAAPNIHDNTAISLDEYQQRAGETVVYNPDHAPFYLTLGLTGEAGEIANKIKKVYRDHDGDFDEVDFWPLIDELGDVLWYLAELASLFGVPLSMVASMNLNKVKDRLARDVVHGEGDVR